MIAYLVCCLILNCIYKKALDDFSYCGRDSFLTMHLNQLRIICDDFDSTRKFKLTKVTMFTRLIFATITILLMHFVSEWFYLAYVLLCAFPSCMTNYKMRQAVKMLRRGSSEVYEECSCMLKVHTVGMVYTLYIYIAISVLQQIW